VTKLYANDEITRFDGTVNLLPVNILKYYNFYIRVTGTLTQIRKRLPVPTILFIRISVSDPDPDSIGSVDPDPDPEGKNDHKNRKKLKNFMFRSAGCYWG
jgi:hypothetical protein